MGKMTMKVVLDSLRASKSEGKCYAEFFFVGGTASFLVDSEQIQKLRGKEGQELDVVFLMRPRSVILFDRPVSLFETVKLIEILVSPSLQAQGLPKMPQTK